MKIIFTSEFFNFLKEKIYHSLDFFFIIFNNTYIIAYFVKDTYLRFMIYIYNIINYFFVCFVK